MAEPSLKAPLPQHYLWLYGLNIRLACIMGFVGLISGILYQESTRKVTYDMLAPGANWEAVNHLALVHGHTILIGVVIPVVVVVMIHLVLRMGGQVLAPWSVRWGGWLYLIGAVAAVLLMIYKGYHFVLSVRMGVLDFETLDHTFFGGSHLVRAIAYGLSHTILSTGLGILLVGIWRSLPGKAASVAE